MPLDANPLNPDHEYRIVPSETPLSEDGYMRGEPKRIECAFCSAGLVLTEEKTPGVWELNHEPWCPDADGEN